MALELGLAALKALYQLAKMIKEAKDNVVLVNNKLKSTHSVEEVIELQLVSIGASLPEDIMQSVKERLVELRRISRRMKIKYRPLLDILDQLGGSSATIKSMSTKLSKGVLSAAMALGCLSVMMHRHSDREEARAVQVLQQLLGAELPEAFLASAIDDPAAVTSDDLLLAAPFPVSQSGADAFMAFRAKCLVLSRTRSVLDLLDVMVAELKAQDAALKDELDKEDGESDEHAKGYSLLPSYRRKTKKTKAEGNGLGEGNGATSLVSDNELRSKGVELVLDSLLCGEGSARHFVDEAKLAKAMGEGFAPERVSFLRRQLGEFEDVELSTKKVITRERFGRMILEEGAHNAGFNIAIISSAVLSTFMSLGNDAPALMQRTNEITSRVIRPLIGYALAFGLLFQIEGMREGVADDPEEIAALQAEADERGLEGRMELMETFSVDFEESYSFNLAPDASLLLSIAIDAGESKYGLGPSTRRRLELLLAILSICNIEVDKKAIEKVENDLKQELSLITSLGSSSVNEKVERLHADLVESSFDSRKLIGGEASTFWVKSFGMSAYEVTWARFRSSLSVNFPLPISERDVKRIQFLLSDPRGMVTLDGFKSFTGGASGGSMVKAVQSVSGGSMNKVMKSLSGSNQLPDGLSDLVVPPRVSSSSSSNSNSPGKRATTGTSSSRSSSPAPTAFGAGPDEAAIRSPSPSPSSSSSPSSSPSQKRLGKVRASKGPA